MCGNARKFMSKAGKAEIPWMAAQGKCIVLPAPVSTAGSHSAQLLALFIVGSIN